MASTRPTFADFSEASVLENLGRPLPGRPVLAHLSWSTTTVWHPKHCREPSLPRLASDLGCTIAVFMFLRLRRTETFDASPFSRHYTLIMLLSHIVRSRWQRYWVGVLPIRIRQWRGKGSRVNASRKSAIITAQSAAPLSPGWIGYQATLAN
ncbi:hypothetical protein OE88DRAFT_1282554 [Heliocybe sulcata]|uniref:Uncharacterized protein n=1 Tax=Heliocybe sulcata TaxID=5364 RepID=A0A5C3NJK1_9AGAM|nr:hypothetical protein OE88DRAFT_1282554 [Heliocybe sulcata]